MTVKRKILNPKARFDLVSLIYLSLSGLTALSLFSYSPRDLSLNSKVYNWSKPTENLFGYLGSFLSDGLLQVFGLGAWAFVLFFFWMFWTRVVAKENRMDAEKALFFFVGVFSFCLGFGFFKSFYIYDGFIFSGGWIGSFVFNALDPIVSKGGIFVFVVISLLITALVFLEKSLDEIFEGLKAFRPSKPRSFSLLSFKKKKQEREDDPFVPPPVIKSEPLSLKKQTRAEESEETLGLQTLDMPSVKRSDFKASDKIPKVQSNSEEGWELPPIEFLGDVPIETSSQLKDEEIQKKAKLLQSKLEQFNVKGQIKGIKTGPAVTLFEYKPNENIKISKITELADDLSLAMSAQSIRIIAPIPGRDVVGIETSNSVRGTVYLKEILSTEDFWDQEKNQIPIGLGKRADGHPMIVDLRKMPHLLVAGSTGSGKSVFVVSTITSLLMRYSPEDLRLVMVDPKQVDLAAFEDLPHLILPIIKEPKKAISSLRWAIREMDKRYRSMAHFGVRKLEEFNEAVEELSDEEYEACVEENENFEESKLVNKTYYYEKLPYIVIIVEEFGDLMAVDKNNVEAAIVRLAQMARACGIHLILAMQSPRKDVVTGLIKTNIPGRISFKVASKMDSRIVLDESGAERLLARGDMLFLSPGVSKPVRAHGSWAPEDVIADIVQHWRDQGEPEYLSDMEDESEDGGSGLTFSGDTDEFDERYDEILDFVSTQKTISASLIQRRFRLGYPRAARIIEEMESQGVIGPPDGSKPRKVLITPFSEKDGV
jgi:S-DNA-T family DNA segregation ATPase FtsK/SpoIIIE